MNLLLISKHSEEDDWELPWGWSSRGMDSENRKLILKGRLPLGFYYHDEAEEETLAAHDGLWGYRYEDTISLVKRV